MVFICASSQTVSSWGSWVRYRYKYYDAQLRHQIMFSFLKLSLDTQNAVFMMFVENYYAIHQGVSSGDKIPLEENH